VLTLMSLRNSGFLGSHKLRFVVAFYLRVIKIALEDKLVGLLIFKIKSLSKIEFNTWNINLSPLFRFAYYNLIKEIVSIIYLIQIFQLLLFTSLNQFPELSIIHLTIWELLHVFIHIGE
jgi:hypothetical protein